MNRHLTKTDNHSIPDKLFLRRKATEGLEQLNILDLYAGNNILWNNFDRARYYGIEIVPGKGCNLTADCHRIISSLDLSGFNVIDCDSYGIPFDVVQQIFENPTLAPGTVIVYTAISNKMSSVSRRCLDMFGLTELSRQSRTLVNGLAINLFYAALERWGVDVVHRYTLKSTYTKHYGYFVVP